MPAHALHHSWRVIATVMTIACVSIVSACGTTDNDGPDPDLSRYDVSKVVKDDTIAALVPQSLAKKGELAVGVNVSYAPAEFFARDGKTPVGYEVDFSKALAKLMGLKARIVHAPFDAIIPSIGSKYAVGITGFTVNKERIKAVDFVTYAKAGLTFATRQANPTHVDPQHLCGKKVAVQVGSVGEPIMYDARDACAAHHDLPLDVLPFKEQTDVTTAVVAGRADVLYADTPVTGYAVKQTNGQLEVLADSGEAEPMGAAVKKGDQAMVKLMHAAIAKLMENGVYRDIMKAWGVEGVMIDKPVINPNVEH